ncbi:MAG: hypothetical protein JWL95_2294 [Gemmatimonadetes bacterium]|nr:hypothetical protein [Gemmatimonadota bacterium]
MADMAPETSPIREHVEADPATGPRSPLRMAVLVDGFEQPVWVTSMLRQIVDAGVAEIVLVIVNAAEADAPAVVRRSLPQRVANWWRKRDVLAYAAYRKLDHRRYLQPGDPEASDDATPLFAGRPVVRVSPRMTKFCDYFDDAAVTEIRGYDVDVALRLGFRILKGDALQIARYGVWSFHHGDNRRNRGGPAGFWEVMDDEPVTGAVLQVLSEELDAGLVLARSYSSTNPISVTSNKHNYYWQAAPLLLSSLRDLRVRGDAMLDEAYVANEWHAYSERLFVAPRGGEMLRLMGRLALRLASRKLRELLTQDQWFIAYRVTKPVAGHENVPDGSPHRFKELIPPNDRFWADPIPVVADGKRYIFFEEFITSSPHAHICVMEVDERGNLGTPRRVLERPDHLSYPFVFEWNGAWYMIPETLKQRAVELYRATRFPDEWVPDRTLLSDVAAVDATVAEIDGRWWMFVGVRAPGAREASMLQIYHAASPLGPWEPHALNPVKIDVRSARPAGPLFRHNGHWYRPAQCGAPTYGSATVVNRIVELTTSSFHEVEVSRLTPTWRPGLNGTHTIAAAGGITVIDARRVRRRF